MLNFHKSLSTKNVKATMLLLLFCLLPMLPAQAESSPLNTQSYVQEFPDAEGKYLLHLEGSPYEIGYAMGYYVPFDVLKLVKGKYVINVLNSLFPFIPKWLAFIPAAWLDFLLWTPGVQSMLDNMAADVPYEYQLEMQGIVDGVHDALGRKRHDLFTYHHVLLVNLLPALQYMTTQNFFDSLISGTFEACQGYVAFGNATYDGSTFMGRHFMWIDDPIAETTFMTEYVPESGHKFVAVTFPGMVGVVTGMNTAGIGCGTEYFAPSDNGGFPEGLGMWFLSRKIVQYAGSLADAETIIRESDEAAPVIFLIGDAKGAGAAFEVYDHNVCPRYADWVSPDADAPDAIEEKDDLVVVTNHAFTPDMYPIDTIASKSSTTRYSILTNLLLDNYGSIDQETGLQIIDYMHPPSTYYPDYYGDDPDQTVKQHVVFMDLTRRTMWALYGQYSDQWVEFTLQ